MSLTYQQQKHFFCDRGKLVWSRASHLSLQNWVCFSSMLLGIVVLAGRIIILLFCFTHCLYLIDKIQCCHMRISIIQYSFFLTFPLSALTFYFSISLFLFYFLFSNLIRNQNSVDDLCMITSELHHFVYLTADNYTFGSLNFSFFKKGSMKTWNLTLKFPQNKYF